MERCLFHIDYNPGLRYVNERKSHVSFDFHSVSLYVVIIFRSREERKGEFLFLIKRVLKLLGLLTNL